MGVFIPLEAMDLVVNISENWRRVTPEFPARHTGWARVRALTVKKCDAGRLCVRLGRSTGGRGLQSVLPASLGQSHGR